MKQSPDAAPIYARLPLFPELARYFAPRGIRAMCKQVAKALAFSNREQLLLQCVIAIQQVIQCGLRDCHDGDENLPQFRVRLVGGDAQVDGFDF